MTDAHEIKNPLNSFAGGGLLQNNFRGGLREFLGLSRLDETVE